MNRKSFTDILFFCFIFYLVILPPLSVQSVASEIFSTWSFPFQQLFNAYIAAIIFCFFYIKKGQNQKRNRTEKQITFFIDSGYTLITFGSLCIIAVGTELFFHFKGFQSQVVPVRPSSVTQYFFCILGFASASFFEEVLYRLYLPDMLFRYISHIPLLSARSSKIISESTAVILFAFSHRYLGAPSVVNAALACIILRICCIKSGSVWTNTAAHFTYNILSLFLFTTV
jgi:membrane protease YdiL (CAAX protease family)